MQKNCSFKVGDLVRVKPYSKIMKEKEKYNYIDNVGFRSDMIFGKVSKIERIISEVGYDLIELKDCQSNWWYHHRWLESPLFKKIEGLMKI